MNLGNFPNADCGRFWILAYTHVDQPKSTEKLNKAILFCFVLDLQLLDYVGHKVPVQIQKSHSGYYLFMSLIRTVFIFRTLAGLGPSSDPKVVL